jgi:hypothetical protein
MQDFVSNQMGFGKFCGINEVPDIKDVLYLL